MDSKILRLKFRAFQETLGSPGGDPIGYRRAVELYDRYAELLRVAIESYPELFAGLRVRQKEEIDTAEINGSQLVFLNTLNPFARDVCEALVLLDGQAEVETRPAATLTSEGAFLAGQTFDALSLVAGILGTASKSIRLVDNYVDETTLSLVSAKKKGVTAAILTRSTSAPLVTLAKAFNVQHGGLELRESQDFHDRFLIIDDKDFFHFGASVKDVGKRVFMFSRIEEPQVTTVVDQAWAAAWSTAKAVV